MISLRPGSQLHRLITLLSVAGEYPTKSLRLLGNERMYKELVANLTKQQTIRNPTVHKSKTDSSITPLRVINVSGKGKRKTIRLYKGALPILKWIDAERDYMTTFRRHKFSGDDTHIERNHRVSEAIAMFMRAGYEFRQSKLPVLQNVEIQRQIFDRPSFYIGRNLKQVGKAEMNKTMFSRMVGAAIAGNNCYAVYNTRDAVMKWCGKGESKAQAGLEEVLRFNSEFEEVKSAILLGASDKVAVATLEDTARNHKLQLRFDAIYNHIHFVPLNEFGLRQLSLFTISDWKEKLLNLMFEDEHRSYGRGSFDYDAYVDGVYVLSHLDGDLARLRRFKESIDAAIVSKTWKKERYVVLCFRDQVSFLTKYLKGIAQIRVVEREAVESRLNLKRRDIFEED